MADITSFLNTIKTAIYGRDMRSALHDSIRAVNDALESEVNRSTAKDESHDRSLTDLDTRLKREVSDRSSADAALSTRITNETTARTDADTALGKRIDDEAETRKADDDALGTRINEEGRARIDGDTKLGTRIDDETAAREELDERFKPVEEKAHEHENKDILDGIDADCVRKWDDGSEGAVTLEEYLEHLRDSEQQFSMLWELIGLHIYDGGWFGVAQDGPPLDGGGFDATELEPFDCGGFESYIVSLSNT